MSAKTVKLKDHMDVTIGVDADERAKVAKKLSGFLASTYTLYLKTLYYHWNVTGPSFVGLHTLFEQQYVDLQTAGDALAERIRAIGHFTPGTVHEYLKLSSVKDDDSLPSSAEEMVRNLLHANEQCSREAREVLDLAEKCGDEVSLDMMVERMNAHDKNAWMLRSILQ